MTGLLVNIPAPLLRYTHQPNRLVYRATLVRSILAVGALPNRPTSHAQHGLIARYPLLLIGFKQCMSKPRYADPLSVICQLFAVANAGAALDVRLFCYAVRKQLAAM